MKKSKEDQEKEESYWEWIIALENNDTNMDYLSWCMSKITMGLTNAINFAINNTIFKEDENGD